MFLVTALALGTPLTAQAFTGEFRLLGAAAYAGRVIDTVGYGYVAGPPHGGSMAGLMADLSFTTGRLRLGPEGFVLRGSTRRVWSLGGIARYEFSLARIRPYALLGAGGYSWSRRIVIDPPPGTVGQPYRQWESDINYFSMSLGAGVAVGPPGGKLALVAELRGHRSVQRGGVGGPRSMVSLGVGGRYRW